MITIGYNQVQEKHVADSNSNAREAKKVYVGNKLAHVHVNDNTEFALRQTLNGYIHEDNDLYAKISKIKGNTKVWNQLIPLSQSRSVNNITFTVNADNSVSVSTTAEGASQNTWFEYTTPRILNHVYLIKGCPVGGSSTTYFYTYGTMAAYDFGAGDIFKASSSVDIEYWPRIRIMQGVILTTPVVFKPIFIDLTLIYGAGNEPTTVAEFEADFQKWFGRPIGAEPYDAGSLIPFMGTGIKSVGFNQWDEEWEVGSISNTGENIAQTDRIRSKNYSRVLSNTTYYLKCPQNIVVHFYDDDKAWISATSGIKDTTFVTPAKACYIRFRTVADYGSIYNNDICINLSNPTLNGTYVPYKATTVPIPVTTLTGKAEGSTTSDVIFPDGMKSAKSVKDEVYIENGKTYAVKRVFGVDMGTLNWVATSANFFYAEVSDMKQPITNADRLDGIVCSKYPVDTEAAIDVTATDKTFKRRLNYIYVRDTSYTDATTFKAAMSGVMLYYELATPIVYEVDNYTLPLYYPANGTGTEELQSTTTSAPADMDIEYRLLEEEWYGIRWRMTNDDWVSPVRIGNPRLHQELPIQSMMKRCALVNGVPKFISESNVDEYEDGTAVDYANTDIYVRIPEYYFEATKDDDGWCELKIHTKVKVGTKSRLYYEGAWLATLDNNVLGSKSYIDFNAIGSPTDGTYNAALFKNATNFVANTPHGGNGSTTYDNTEGCTIGRPKTSITIANFRTYANNNSNRHGIVNYDCWCSIMRLFMVEFCSFYSQAAIDDTLTVHKFRKGGLSAGVTSGLTNWSNFNGYNPLIPCGFTKSLGNRTGVIKMHYAAEGAQTSAVNMSVPSYRGIEEPFGDIYNFVDGIAIYGDGADTQKASIYIATAATIDNNVYVTPSGANATPTGYELLTDDAPYKEASDSETSGYIKVWHWDEHGMFAPLKTGGNSTTVGLTDYMYMYNGTGWRLLLAGGGANHGGNAGPGCFYGYNGFGGSRAYVGSRLLYTPAS